jgi:hypothetical protein
MRPVIAAAARRTWVDFITCLSAGNARKFKWEGNSLRDRSL